MNILKGFMEMSILSDNRLDKTAAFGELTTQSKTFTRDIRQYANSDQRDVRLSVFRCVDEMLARVEPSTGFTNTVLAFGQWVYQQHIAKSIPADRNKPAFVKAIEEQFPTITGVVIGEILTSDRPDYNMPDYVQFKLLDGITQYQLFIWFADTSFQLQYDETEIFIIPPLPDIASLISNKLSVHNQLMEQPPSTIVNRIQEIRGEHPETALIPYDLRWHDPEDANAVLLTTWTAVVYGKAGADTEAIKDAIREYISDHSDYDKWNQIYPDLYSENEFVFVPMWSDVALQDNALQVGLFSSLVRLTDVNATVRKYLPSGYTQSTDVAAFLSEYLLVGAAYYRTLMFGVIGNPNNRGEVYDIRQVFPDYMALDTLEEDFGRMSIKTQQFVTRLNEAMGLAYKFKPTDTLTPGYTRLIRRGFYYLSFEFEGYNYPILTKHTFDTFN